MNCNKLPWAWLTALALCSSAIVPSRAQAHAGDGSPQQTESEPHAKKAASLLEAARGKLDKSGVHDEHRQKALSEIGSALTALSSVAKSQSESRTTNDELAAEDPRLSAALKLLVAAAGELKKAGAAYDKARTHVDNAIALVKTSLRGA